jgi:hypothetical protein
MSAHGHAVRNISVSALRETGQTPAAEPPAQLQDVFKTASSDGRVTRDDVIRSLGRAVRPLGYLSVSKISSPDTTQGIEGPAEDIDAMLQLALREFRLSKTDELHFS